MPEDKPQEERAGLVIPPPTTIRAGRQKGEDREKPDSLSARLLVKARLLSDRLYERRSELHKTMGGPLKSGELSATERKAQYRELISSRELLIKALAGAAIVGRDGRLRLSTAMVDAFVELSDA